MANETTKRLTEVLRRTHPEEAGRVLEEYAEKLVPGEGAFSEYVRAVIKRRGCTQQGVFRMADIPERYGYKLVSGEKRTNRRDILLRLFLAAGFSLEEVERALKLYGMAELYPRFPRDAVLMIAFNSGMRDPYSVDELLEKHGEAPLARCGSEE